MPWMTLTDGIPTDGYGMRSVMTKHEAALRVLAALFDSTTISEDPRRSELVEMDQRMDEAAAIVREALKEEA